jgi:uncharacterized membrane protein
MKALRQAWSDENLDRLLSWLLLIGVLLAAAVVLAGGIYHLIRHGATVPHFEVFHGEPAEYRDPALILRDALHLHSRAIIQLGLLVLVLTPIARVAFSVVGFLRERDWTYVGTTLVVLAVLLYNLLR